MIEFLSHRLASNFGNAAGFNRFLPRTLVPHGTKLYLGLFFGLFLFGGFHCFARQSMPPQSMTMDSTAAKTQFVEANGVRFAYRAFGAGKPLLLIQRFRGTMNDWDPDFLNALAKKRQVIVFDNAGVGSSSGKVPDSIAAMAKDIASFLQALKIKQTDVFGWSLGGIEAQALALDYPTLVSRVVLAGTAPAGSPETVPGQEQFSKVAGKPALADDDFLFLFYTNSDASRQAGRSSQNRIASALQAREKRGEKLGLTVSEENWHAQYQALLGWFGGKDDYFSRLKTLRQPALVANGDRDLAFPVFDSVLLAREIPKSQLIIYPDAGHGFQHQFPTEFAAQIHSFLDSSLATGAINPN